MKMDVGVYHHQHEIVYFFKGTKGREAGFNVPGNIFKFIKGTLGNLRKSGFILRTHQNEGSKRGLLWP